MYEKLLLTRAERRGIIVFLFLLFIVLATCWYVARKGRQGGEVVPVDSTFFYAQKQDESVVRQWKRQNDSLVQVIAAERLKRKSWRDEPVSLHSFDPNQADSLELRSLGLPPWSVHGILQYRRHSGRFRQSSDVARIYNLSDEDFRRIEPYIVIHQDTTIHEGAYKVATVVTEDRHPGIEKYQPGTQINLNAADTTELQKIPGIGPSIARQICYWRSRLGGFTSVSQLGELETFIRREQGGTTLRLDAAKLASWFYVTSDSIHRIAVNRSSLDRLMRHPYINFYQAKAIVDYRRKVGKLSSLTPLRLLEEFSDADIERMTPYLDFN